MKNKTLLKLLTGSIILFAGLDLAILLSHLPRGIGVVMAVIGLAILAQTFKTEEELKDLFKPKEEDTGEKSLLTKILNLMSLGGRMTPLFPLLGILVIIIDMIYNMMGTKFYLGSNDYVVLLLGAVLLVYNYVPKKYAVERDFAFIFIVLLFLILVVPLTLYELRYGYLLENTNSPFVYYLLARPTAIVLNWVGIETMVYNYDTLEYARQGGGYGVVSIGLSCTGLYSVSIFVSFFFAFIFTEYRQINKKVALLLSLGLFTAWFANILRMFIIVMVGSYYGNDALQWTHNNIGEVIFMVWIFIFWFFMFKYLDVVPKKENIEDELPKETPKNICGICGEHLSSARPAVRCKCGKVYHSECAGEVGQCPVCGFELQGPKNDL